MTKATVNKATSKATATANTSKDNKAVTTASNWLDTLFNGSLKQTGCKVLTDAQIATNKQKLTFAGLVQYDKCQLIGYNKQAVAQILFDIATATGKTPVCKASHYVLCQTGVYYNVSGLLVKQAIYGQTPLYLDKAGQKKCAGGDWTITVSKQLASNKDFYSNIVQCYVTGAKDKDTTANGIYTALNAMYSKSKSVLSKHIADKVTSVLSKPVKASKTA